MPKQKKRVLVRLDIDNDLMDWLNEIAKLADTSLESVVSVILSIEVVAAQKAKKPAKTKKRR